MPFLGMPIHHILFTFKHPQFMGKFEEMCERLKRMDALIRRRGTGAPRAFAKLLGISRSTLFLYLGLLKDYGAEIAYDRERESYYYERDFTLQL